MPRPVRRLSGFSRSNQTDLGALCPDIDPSQDNNEKSRNSWSNWCGPNRKDGSYLDPVRCQQLLDTLMHVTGTASPRSSPDLDEEDDGPPPHVFQILDHTGEAIVSFPAESSKPYDRREYATLACEVVARRRDNNDAKTSCTRRYRSKHPMCVFRSSTSCAHDPCSMRPFAA